MSTKGTFKEVGRYGTVGIELVISMMLGYYGGHWLDVKYAHDAGYVTMAGLGVGLFAGFRQLYRVTKQAERDFARQDAEEKQRRELALNPESRETGTRHDSDEPDDDDTDD